MGERGIGWYGALVFAIAILGAEACASRQADESLTSRGAPARPAVTGAQPAAPASASLDAGDDDGPGVRLAIMPFEGSSYPPRAEFAHWSAELQNRLGSELASTRKVRIDVLDRARMAEMIRELGICASQPENPSCAVRVGRWLGAQYYILGTYNVMLDEAVIAARIVDVETGKITGSERSEGGSGEMPQLVAALATKLAQSRWTEELASRGGPPPAAKAACDEAERALKAGDYDRAIEAATRALEIDPANKKATRIIKEAGDAGIRR